MSDEERQRFLYACRQSHWNKLTLLVLMGMTTGARLGELLILRWSDIDFKNNSTYLGDTKNGNAKELHFPLVVMTELRSFQEVGSGLIFPGRNRNRPKDFRNDMEKALEMAEIPTKKIHNPDGSVKLEKFTFHCLRHGFCSALSDSGKEINQIAKLTGHKSIQTTMRYIHQGSDQKRKIVNELAKSFSL